jgi:HSP20 family molecular chaperone IbpA
MGPRKCIYTGEEANSKEGVMPRDPNTLHNWVNKAPTSAAYQQKKQGRLPTDLEMEANRIFYLLELARLDVAYLEAKLRETQAKITGKKQEEIEKAYHVKELVENFESQAQEKLDSDKKKLWE